MMVKERKIGDEFNIASGKKTKTRLKVEASNENKCDGCFFEKSKKHVGCFTANRGECNGYVRSDNTPVIFVKID